MAARTSGWAGPAAAGAGRRRAGRGAGRGGRLRLASLVALGLGWHLASVALDSRALPGPAAVAERLVAQVLSGELPLHFAATLARVAASFVLAMAAGSAVGIAMGRWRAADRLLDPWLVIGLNVPALVVAVLCYVWFGLGELAAVAAVALNKIPTVVVLVREGARAIEPELLDVARGFRVPWHVTLRAVYLPQLHPSLMAAARAGLALIWKVVLVVEMLGRSDGIGFQLSVFFQFFDVAGILAYTLALVALMLALEMAVLRPLERRLTGWRL